jgi:hypothetical protein
MKKEMFERLYEGMKSCFEQVGGETNSLPDKLESILGKEVLQKEAIDIVANARKCYSIAYNVAEGTPISNEEAIKFVLNLAEEGITDYFDTNFKKY